MIYLINPVILESFSVSRIGRCVSKAKAEYIYPPVELLYVASYLKKNGLDADVIDGALEKSYDDVKKKIKDPEVFILMVGIFSYKYDTRFITWLKKKYPMAKVIVFGQGASFITDDYLDHADYVIFGEPEKAILELLEKKTDILGVSFKKDGKKVINKKANLLKSLDDMPFPLRELIKNSLYRHAFLNPFTLVYSSRGCPYKCTFCTSEGYSPVYRVRSVDNVIDELKEIKYEHKISNFAFMDETFTINKKRTIDICRTMIDNNLNMTWIALGRVDRIDEEMLYYMKKAGCRIILYGIESFDQEVLDSLNKGVSVSDNRKAIRLTKKSGIEAHGFFIFGSPKDTKEKIKKTINEAIKLNLDYASFNIFVPYPGTKAFHALDEAGLINTYEWSDYDQTMNKLVFRNPNISDIEIQKLIRNAYKRFYFNPRFVLNRLIKDILNPSMLSRDVGNLRKIWKNFL